MTWRKLLWTGFALPLLLAGACSSSTGTQTPGATETPAPSVDPVRGDCRPTLAHVPFPVVMPTYLPDAVKFLEACTHQEVFQAGLPPLSNVEVYFYDDARTAWFQVVTANLDVLPKDRETLMFGRIVAYISRTPRDDGTELYSVEMSLAGRAYTVIAILGPPGNVLTEEDLNKVAESMAAVVGG